MTVFTENKVSIKVYRMVTPDHECPWGLKAIHLLTEQGFEFEDIPLRSREEVDAFKAQWGVATTPQIFFGDTRIGGYTDLAAYLKVQPTQAEYSYTPVIALFTTAGLMTLATSLGVSGFMGISLSMLASLKLMDLQSFSEQFEKYDWLTKRLKPYGKVYPFAELLIGLGFLSGVAPIATGIGSLALGVSGAASVFKAVYIDKLALNCACVGGNSKAPLGLVSMIENAMMAGMGTMLLASSLSSCAIGLEPSSKAQPSGMGMDHSSLPHSAGMGHSGMDLGPADDAYDLRFLDAMVPHHEGAVRMAKAVLKHSQRPELRQLATAIITAQNSEIAQMQEWRKRWYPKAPAQPMAWNAQMNHMMPRTPEQTRAMRMDVNLEPGDAQFDIRFLDAMIPHHEGAVTMAKDLSQKTQRPELQTLAQAILASQQAEIDQMKAWRKTWAQ